MSEGGLAPSLWSSLDAASWRAALASYPSVVEARAAMPRRHEATSDTPRLPSLDAWYRRELPALVAARVPPHITVEELGRVVAWKMKRGKFRPRNLQLARGNDPARVVRTSTDGFALADRLVGGEEAAERAALAKIVELDGVGPATASAVLAVHCPSHFPFFDEDVARAAGLPDDFTTPVYLAYARALRAKAALLDGEWTAQDVGLALWAAALAP